jgi:hypothetical protein
MILDSNEECPKIPPSRAQQPFPCPSKFFCNPVFSYHHLGINFDYTCEFRVIMRQVHLNESIKFGMGSTLSHSSFQTCLFTRRKQLKARFNLPVSLLSRLSRQEFRGRLRQPTLDEFPHRQQRTRSLPLINHGNKSI